MNDGSSSWIAIRFLRRGSAAGERRRELASAVLASTLAATSTLIATSALGAQPSHSIERSRAHPERSHEGSEMHNTFTLKLAALEALTPSSEDEPEAEPLGRDSHHDPSVTHLGVAVSYERALIPGALALELNAIVAPGAEGVTLPLELLVKKPFELSRVAEPFVGVGLAAEWLEEGTYHPRYGVGADLGSYFWLGRHMGLVVEAEYGLLLTREVSHELVLATGGALRF